MTYLIPILVFTVLVSAADAKGQISSRYTELAPEKCKTIELTDDEGGSYRGECAGVAGYRLEVLEGDLRQSINIVSPDRKVHELKFWEIFGGFSSVGPRAEWRLRSGKPIALIVRLNVSENPEDSSKLTSYLLVAKITNNEACVTDTIKPSRTQNADARRAADSSSRKSCKR